MHPYRAWIESYLIFQLVGDGKHDTLDLSIERDHPALIAEAYELISMILSSHAEEREIPGAP